MYRTAAGANRAKRSAGYVAGGAHGAVLIVFGTTEGHTQKLAEFVAARLAASARQVTLLPAAQADGEMDLSPFGAIFIASSLHWRRYQNSVIEFAQRHHQALNAARSAFISVSLAAAGVRQPDDFTLEDGVGAFEQETSWKPQALHHAAGRIAHSAYDYFKCLAAKLVADQRGEAITTTADYDLTDYEALAAFVLGFAAEAARPTSA